MSGKRERRSFKRMRRKRIECRVRNIKGNMGRIIGMDVEEGRNRIMKN